MNISKSLCSVKSPEEEPVIDAEFQTVTEEVDDDEKGITIQRDTPHYTLALLLSPAKKKYSQVYLRWAFAFGCVIYCFTLVCYICSQATATITITTIIATREGNISLIVKPGPAQSI